MDHGANSAASASAPNKARVKNKSAAPIQISAEQLLREASDRLDPSISTKKQIKELTQFQDVDEMRQRNRQFFEDKIRRDRSKISIWVRYAAFEESQREWARARSVYERALDVDPYNITLFLKYAEMEMKNKNVNLARNIWDRAVTIQPRVDQFWYKYALMEETLGNLEGAREVWERWMQWEPEEAVWFSYIKFERRYREFKRIRAIYERMVKLFPAKTSVYLAYAKFEEDGKHFDLARSIFERATEAIASPEPRLFVEFAKFEVRLKEFERARVIYRFALDRFAKSEAEGLYHSYAQFERQFGTEESMLNVVLIKRRMQYEEAIQENPHNYDVWFDYLRLEEDHGDVDVIRECYERAIACVPPAEEKRLWRRYIYLWIYYAIFEEGVAGDEERALAIYKTCLNQIIPHRKFTFAKVWNLAAQFHLRRLDLTAARKTMGMALGMCPKPKIFKDYIQMELSLREFDRCRILYEKFLQFDPTNASTWIKYAELERLLMDDERARAIFELAIDLPEVDLPETIWKAYIDFEFESGNYDAVRDLYERLIDRTEHVKVWVSYANFEATLAAAGEGEEGLSRMRSLINRAKKSLKDQDLVTERMLLLQAAKEMEARQPNPDAEAMAAIEAAMPKQVVRKRKNDDGVLEEYVDIVFPEDEDASTGEGASKASKLLAMAQKWKKAQQSDSNQ